MNKNKYKLIGLFLLLASAILKAQQTVVLSSGEWLPFQSQNLKHGGVVARIVSQAF
ncbi:MULTISPECIES: hypothetical protein [unclassified Oleiphilus]|uniref:hypothetical protein n=1 Tax=unclassified Oleiphilus TaxID=2631174 RepID=UPI000B28AB95|nr:MULTISPECIES: hypothetical protein [unclassified Oleiphilus]